MIYRVSQEGTLLQFLKENIKEAPSVKAIKRAIDNRGCKVNGKLERFSSRRLKKGDTVEFSYQEPKEIPKSAAILYEDDDFLAIDKPAGVVTSEPSIGKLLPKKRFWLVHRLDKETSGVLLLAKTMAAKKKLEELFLTRKVHKTYLAIVHGWLHEKEKTLSSILIKERTYQGQTIYKSVEKGSGVRAITRFVLLKKGKEAALIECHPTTGRTHQLRVQLAALGSPILGDVQYGRKQGDAGIDRHMLHAWKLTLTHPKSDEEIAITAPLPADFKQELESQKITFF